MSEQKALPRPRQVTLAAGMAAASCVLLVVALFDAMAKLRTPEMRDTVSEWLARPPGDGLGIDVQQALAIVRGVLLFNGALAAAAVVLAVFTLQRHNGARIAFTVAAAVLLFTAPLSGGVLPMVIAASAVLLWSAPARDWFAGREPRPVPARDAAPRPDRLRSEQPDEPRTAVPAEPQQPIGTQPGPSSYPFGSAPQGPSSPQAPQPGFAGYPPYGYPVPQQPAGGPGKRPAGVTAAAWLTWVFAGVTVGIYLLMLLMLVALKDQVLTAIRQDARFDNLDMSGNQLIAVLWVVGVVVIFWCLSAIVLASLTLRRLGWARVLLAVSTGFAALLALFATVTGAFFAALIVVACIVTLVLLFNPEANAWFAGRPSSRPQPPAYGGPGAPTYGAPPPADRSKDERPDVW